MFQIQNYNFERNEEKNLILKETRGIGFEDVIKALNDVRNIIDIIPNPNIEIYKNQQHLIIKINNYPYVIPFIIKGNVCFLKTIYANRKYKNF